MKRNTVITFIFGTLLAFTVTSCFNGPIVKGSKNYITKEVDIEDFSNIHVSGSAEIIYRQDTCYHIEIYGSDNIVDLMETTVNNGKLIVKYKKNVTIIDRGKLEIKVSSPDLNSLTLSGSGGISFANGIRTEGDLAVTINGSGNLKGSDLQCRQLAVAIHGSGNVKLQQINSEACSANIAGSGNINMKGRSNEAQYRISGSGDIKAADLEAEVVSANISGSGSITCYATQNLSGGISGSGSVGYKGNPPTIDFPRKKLRKLD